MLDRVKKPLAIALVVIIAGFLLGFRVGHPHSGLKSAMGSAHSSIAIYKRGGEPAIGAKVMIDIPTEPNNSPALGYVRATTKGAVEVQLANGVTVVPMKSVQGKLIAVVPFFGTLVGFLGL